MFQKQSNRHVPDFIMTAALLARPVGKEVMGLINDTQEKAGAGASGYTCNQFGDDVQPFGILIVTGEGAMADFTKFVSETLEPKYGPKPEGSETESVNPADLKTGEGVPLLELFKAVASGELKLDDAGEPIITDEFVAAYKARSGEAPAETN